MYHCILKKCIFCRNFSIFGYFCWIFFAIPLNIRKKIVAEGKLRLKGCLAMCLIFQENSGSRAYKLVAYKKKCNAYDINDESYRSNPINTTTTDGRSQGS